MTFESFPYWSIVAFFAMLGCSAFFSSSETALFSLTRAQIDELSKRRDPAAMRLTRLLDDPRRLLIVLLTGNTIINILAATLAALVTSSLLGESVVAAWVVFAVQVIAVTLVIVITGDILPKLAAIRNPLAWSLSIATPLAFVTKLFTPLVALLLPFSDFVARTLGVEKRKLWISEDEIKTLVEVGEERGALETTEKELIHSIFEFSDTTVREIMVPRTDMRCLDINTSIDMVLEFIRESEHTRIPIYSGSIDNIIGVLHTKDLLLKYPFDTPFDLRTILREASYVPEAKLISELLKQFQDRRLHMAIAVDEYGGTAGLVTLEDVIEEIVGEIQDEHDTERPLWTKLDDNTIIADAMLDVETVNQVLDDDVIPTDQDFETLGGFILNELGEFPEAKTALDFHNYEFVVEEVSGHRLGRVRIIKRESITEGSK
ncbi:HlyC/CorC family transporter [candidate division KSB1 bacterium]|nr:HlyC/CorC family transporter [candidate division KSB1 bacterium]